MFKETKTLGNWPLMKNQLHSCRCMWTALHGGLCWSSASSVVLLKSGHSFAASTTCVNCSVSHLYFSFSSFVDTHDCPAGYSYHIVWSVVCTPTYSAQWRISAKVEFHPKITFFSWTITCFVMHHLYNFARELQYFYFPSLALWVAVNKGLLVQRNWSYETSFTLF